MSQEVLTVRLLDVAANEDGSTYDPIADTGWFVPTAITVQRRLGFCEEWVEVGDGVLMQLRVAPIHRDLVVVRPGLTDDVPTHRVHADGHLLGQFAGLAAAKPARIQAFAERWGLLGITSDQTCEALAVWVEFAAQVAAMLRIHAAITMVRRENPDDVHRIGQPWDDFSEEMEDAADARTALAGVVNRWLAIAAPQVYLARVPNQAALQPRLRMRRLFDALAVQLMLRVSSEKALMACSECGSWYKPTRRPREDQRQYCDRRDCRKAASRYSTKMWRGRQATSLP